MPLGERIVMTGFPSWLTPCELKALKLATKRGYDFDFGDEPETVTVVTCRFCRPGYEDNVFLARETPPSESHAARYPLGEGIWGREHFGGGMPPTRKHVKGSIETVVLAVLAWDAEEGNEP
ncbi:hypothetical protein [Amycolatopsis sp. H20-H5]|uniref:hypothetical protein n=1 Tax=Amycolatopsis sp. H20-H5 TaxID=3046309 RepID=UPI002DB6F5A4|nr:hypothetical protein [Amycolatopsis sp. H20-H5]MEC3977755.1 hypothetical protein [Amycolatopsis sp. H20-H5]